jgi:predicted Zn finger-like uncharacterized protein
MIVICEECGKKYRLDPEKIRSSGAKFKCKTCSHEIVLRKPDEQAGPALEQALEPPSSPQPGARERSAREQAGDAPPRKVRLGVRGKMILLFLLLPGIISGTAAFYALSQISRTAEVIVEASSSTMRHVGELIMANESMSLTELVAERLTGRESISPADLAGDESIRSILGTISWGGSAFVYTIPDSSTDGWKTWAHTDPALVGMTLDSLQERLGDGYSGFRGIYSAVGSASSAKGYFHASAPAGTAGEAYLIVRHIEGTPYVVGLTAPVEAMMGFSLGIQELAEHQVYRSSMVTSGIMLFAFLLIAITVTVYGHRLTGRIKYLTDVSDRISVGDLETEIRIKSNDEIGELAESISRMQDSLRLSIERLRRRR